MENINLDIKQFLDQDQKKDLLRLLTAGSVDDGKSTLIGRLMFDSKMLYEDQLSALPAKTSIMPCYWTALKPNGNKASPLMWHTVTSQQPGGNSSLPTPPVMSNTPAI